MQIKRTIQNIRRVRELISVLFKYGFEEVVTHSQLRRFVSRKRRIKWTRRGKPVFEYSRFERIRMAAEELGPTFVKLCQVLSNRPDIIPDGLIKEFEKLQSSVPPFPTEKAIATIEKESGKKISELFSYFEEKVLGSASIGQVHRARLITGEEVVVKVQRPGVRKQIESDLQIIKDIVTFGDNYFKKQGVLNAMEIVESFENIMQKELLYLTEARSMDQFRKFYKDNHTFYVPKPYKEFSTEKILIIEFVSGCKITDVEQLREWGLEPTEVAEAGMDVYLTQIFEYGYFHADPHPGNIIIQENGRIVLIDFGMVGKMMAQDKYAFAGVFIAMANSDAKQMAIQLRALSIEHDIRDMRRLEMELNDIIEDFAYLDVDESSIADISTRLQAIMYKHKMVVPGGVFLIFRALAILEGIGKTIHPHFNTMEKVKPFGRKLVMEQYSTKNLWKEFTFRGQSFYSFLSSFPYELKGILRKLRKGELQIEIEHLGRKSLLDKLDAVSNRLSLSLLSSALIVAASIIMTADPGYARGEGMPTISIVLFLMASGLGAFTLWSILFGGKNE
ncbi:MAG TPA: AarF/ABC1/UbiB kinase family protein [Bacteroidetes bacterium]|nr:AarF/ABC1/UbiB kinase family protein [Bacteroidota bacterium]